MNDQSMTLELDMTINYGWLDARLALDERCRDVLNVTKEFCEQFEKQIPFAILQDLIWTPPMQVWHHKFQITFGIINDIYFSDLDSQAD